MATPDQYETCHTTQPLPFWRSAIIYLLLFCATTCVVLALQGGYAFRYGTDWTRLLHLASDSSAFAWAHNDFDRLSLAPSGCGHDGQFSYVIAREPFGNPAVDLPPMQKAFRYRRLLYSLLAGGGGAFSPRATVWGLIILAAVGAGLAAAALGILAEKYSLSSLVVLSVVANPGVVTAAVILTSDNLALGLAMTGLLLWLNGHHRWGAAAFAAAALTKEVYWLFPLGLASWIWLCGRRKEALLLPVITAVPVLVWALRIEFFSDFSGAFDPWGDFTWPLLGILRSIPHWHVGSQDFVWSLITLAALILSIRALCTSPSRLLRCLAWPWVLTAVLVSEWIWTLGNNSIRDLLPLVIIAACDIALRRSPPGYSSESPEPARSG